MDQSQETPINRSNSDSVLKCQYSRWKVLDNVIKVSQVILTHLHSPIYPSPIDYQGLDYI